MTMAIPRGTRCSEWGCINYIDEEGIGSGRDRCKPCRDEILLEKLHTGRYVGDGRTEKGLRSAEAARARREAEDENYVRLMSPPKANVPAALRMIEEWKR